jgi:hypothetical protein
MTKCKKCGMNASEQGRLSGLVGRITPTIGGIAIAVGARAQTGEGFLLRVVSPAYAGLVLLLGLLSLGEYGRRASAMRA